MVDHTPPRVGVVGLGNMGTAIAHLVTLHDCDVIGWEYDAGVVEEVNTHHTNARFLADVELSPHLAATQDVRAVFDRTAMVFIALPSRFIQSTLQPVCEAGGPAPDTIIVNMAKGIDARTGLTAFQTVVDLFPANPCVMLSGPSIAHEFAHGQPTVVVLAGPDPAKLMQVAHVLDVRHFRTRFSSDTIGVELGGVLKNIYAIGLGLFDGQNIRSVNFRSVYLTSALEEMTRLGVAMGAQAATFAYLAGLGDLLATSLSEHSHNRRLGELLSQGLTLEEIQRRMGVLPEGYNTLKVALNLAEKLSTRLPLAKGLWDVIHGRYDPNSFIFSFIRDFVD